MFNLEHLLKVLDPEPLLLDQAACLVTRHRRSACRACIERCPEAALSLEDGQVAVDPARCSRCGLCAGVCPTAAITVRGIDEGAVIGSPTASCSKADGAGNRLPCLGALHPDLLLAMGLRFEAVELHHGDCEACRWRAGGQAAARAVETAQAALHALGSSHTIQLIGRDEVALATRPLSRRDLFGLWRTESVQVARQFAPAQEVNHAKLPARLPTRRSRWLRQADPAAASADAVMPAGPWKARVVSEACNGCGICVVLCPTGAFAKQEGEEEAWLLTHQPAACVGCNTCAELCPTQAISEEPLTASALLTGQVREVARRTAQRCRSCQRAFKGRPGESQCPQCRSMLDIFQI